MLQMVAALQCLALHTPLALGYNPRACATSPTDNLELQLFERTLPPLPKYQLKISTTKLNNSYFIQCLTLYIQCAWHGVFYFTPPIAVHCMIRCCPFAFIWFTPARVPAHPRFTAFWLQMCPHTRACTLILRIKKFPPTQAYNEHPLDLEC